MRRIENRILYGTRYSATRQYFSTTALHLLHGFCCASELRVLFILMSVKVLISAVFLMCSSTLHLPRVSSHNVLPTCCYYYTLLSLYIKSVPRNEHSAPSAPESSGRNTPLLNSSANQHTAVPTNTQRRQPTHGGANCNQHTAAPTNTQQYQQGRIMLGQLDSIGSNPV